MLLKRSLLVFTNKRILHVPTHADYAYRRSLAMVDYRWCRAVVAKGANLTLTYHNGQSERFSCVDVHERKKLKAMFAENLLPASGPDVRRRTFLCPNCGQMLAPEVAPCVHCGQAFRSTATMRLLSLLFPGGGYFYTRHPLLGIADAVAETMLTLYVLFAAVSMFAGHTELMGPMVLFSVILAMEKAVTLYECGHFIHEFIPARRRALCQHPSQPVASIPSTRAVLPATRPKIAVEVPAEDAPESVLRAGESL